MIVGAVCIVLSAILTHYLGKYIVKKENILKIITGFAAGFGCYLLVVGIAMESWLKYTAVVGAGIAGACLIRGNETVIIAFSTAFLGSVMMMHGLSMYLGGFPSVSNVESVKNQKLTTEFIGYLGGIVVMTLIGGNY